MSDDTDSLGKIANVLALILTKDQSKGSAAATLNSCGFTNREIAALMGSSEGSVRSLISQARKKQDG